MRALIALQVLFLIANAWAVDVTISCAQVPDSNQFIVSYTASAEANIPRAFALDIQLNNDEKIHNVTILDPNYWVTPGAYPGSDPVGDPADSSDTLPGEDSNGITIEMGSLHSPPEVDSPNNPEISNELLSFTVTGNCEITISGNAARGKVVFYDGTNEDDGRDVVYTGCSVCTDPFPCDHPDYDQWVLVGKPFCWVNPRQCQGDADGAFFGKNSYWVSTPDLTILKAAWEKALPDLGGEPNICADFDHAPFGKNSYRVATPDLTILKLYWEQPGGPDPNCF